MWNGRVHAAMAVAALSAVVAGPASAEYRYSNNGTAYRNHGYAGVYGYGRPAASNDAAGYGVSSTHGYGGSYAVSYGGGVENGQSPSTAAAAPAPERTRSIVHRRGPKRLE